MATGHGAPAPRRHREATAERAAGPAAAARSARRCLRLGVLKALAQADGGAPVHALNSQDSSTVGASVYSTARRLATCAATGAGGEQQPGRDAHVLCLWVCQ